MVLLLTVFFLPALLVHCGESPVRLFITAPRRLEAVNGSCLIIPCSFTLPPGTELDKNQRIVAVWIKDDAHFKDHPERIVYNSSEAVNVPNISIIGELKERNCTTKFNRFIERSTSTKFFFRIENGKFMATAVNDPVLIEVKAAGSPPRPTLTVSGELRENRWVTITCSAPTPCPHSPPRLSWSPRPDAHSHTERQSDGTFTTEIQQSFTVSAQHDGQTLSCSAAYPVGGGEDVEPAEEQLTLSVSYAPKHTLASISQSGSLVNLSCSSRAKPAVSSFTWYKTSRPRPIRVSEGQFYTFDVANLTQSESFYCVAENDLGNQTSQEIPVKKAEIDISVPVGVAVSVGMLICLVFSVWCFKKCGTSPQTQTPSAGEFSGHELSDEAGRDDGGKEELHYQSVSFAPRRTEAPSVQAPPQGEDTLYAQVKVHQAERNSWAPAAGVSEELYAQVKRK